MLFRGHALYRGDVALNTVAGGYAPTPLREALWRTYLFESLLRRVNAKLTSAAAISVGWRL
jgi:hypothetical protein